MLHEETDIFLMFPSSLFYAQLAAPLDMITASLPLSLFAFRDNSPIPLN